MAAYTFRNPNFKYLEIIDHRLQTEPRLAEHLGRPPLWTTLYSNGLIFAESESGFTDCVERQRLNLELAIADVEVSRL